MPNVRYVVAERLTFYQLCHNVKTFVYRHDIRFLLIDAFSELQIQSILWHSTL
jgi:hypothetical protein